jgi:hypothetical protein
MEKGIVKDRNKNVHIEQLLTTLEHSQWISLSHIRCRPYPVTLEDKRKLLLEMIVK